MPRPDLLIRTAAPADVPGIAHIHVASWRDAYRNAIPDAVIDARTIEGAIEMWKANLAKFPGNLTVAKASDAPIAGFSCAGPVIEGSRSAPYEFEVYALHVRPEMRRHGIGAALLRDAIRRAKDDLHLRSMIVWTLEDLHLSRRFYEREGGRLVKHGEWQAGGVTLRDVGYGWDLSFDRRHFKRRNCL